MYQLRLRVPLKAPAGSSRLHLRGMGTSLRAESGLAYDGEGMKGAELVLFMWPLKRGAPSGIAEMSSALFSWLALLLKPAS